MCFNFHMVQILVSCKKRSMGREARYKIKKKYIDIVLLTRTRARKNHQQNQLHHRPITTVHLRHDSFDRVQNHMIEDLCLVRYQ